MSEVLGLDLGTNSIGWAIVDTERKEIINIGCQIFRNPINEINVNGKVLLKKSTKIRTLMPKELSRVYKFVQRNIIISIFFFLQIITLFFLLINFHDWQFWFSLSFTVLIGLLSIINGSRK